ncbi:MAG: response regulator, partial [Chitinispirillaceae bacterium]|nr:response regulator [Chitinispirillaceae bacterium]
MSGPAAIRILVVDDEAEMRQMIVDYLRDLEQHDVTDAHDAVEALAILETQAFDLILSDINMPGMKGFDLLKIVRQKYPAVKRVLITAYNVEDYLELALNYDIGNIFVKTVPFNFTELSVLIRNLFSNDIFGLNHYFDPAAGRNRFLIKNARLLDSHARVITSLIDDPKRAKHLELVIIELLTNAIFYGARNESTEERTGWDLDRELPENTEIVVSVA